MSAAVALGLLALDFDGVVVDSAREVLAVATATYAELEPEASQRLAQRSLAELEEGFRRLLPLGNRAEDFGTTLELLADAGETLDQAGFDACHQRRGEQRHQAFHDAFYRHREALVKVDSDAWLDLHRLYPGIEATLRRLAAGGLRLGIATAKDRASVERLLDHYGLEDLISGDWLVDKSAGRSKQAHLRRLLELAALPGAAALFIDDKVSHLDRVAELGVGTGLAAWGHNTPREHALAASRGHRVLHLESFESGLLSG